MRHNAPKWFALTVFVIAGCPAVRAQDAGVPAGTAQARTPRRQAAAPVMYLSDLSVDTLSEGLKLTDEQKTKIQAVLDKRAADYKTLILPAEQQGQAPAVQEANRKRTEFAEKADADIAAVLTEDQKKMLPEYKGSLQFFRLAGLPLPLVNTLKITEDQKAKITTQATENRRAMRQKAREAQQSGTAMTAAARQAMLKENQDKILALLTPDQKAALDKYTKDHPTTPAAVTPASEQNKSAGGNP